MNDHATELARSTRARFENAGYCVIPQVLPADLIGRANRHMDDVIDRRYETGVTPRRWNGSGSENPTALVKIDHPHLADRTILELVSHPALGRWAAEVVNAQMVQVWAVQLLHKPAGGTPSGNVGWHQDHHYWRTWWEGEVFTAWVPIVDISPDMGPVRYVHGSHRWGYRTGGDFFETDLDRLRGGLKPPDASWREEEATMPAGAAALHHRLTFHGSGPNISSSARRSFAIHLRTEKSRPLSTAPKEYGGRLDDETACPVIYRRT